MHMDVLFVLNSLKYSRTTDTSLLTDIAPPEIFCNKKFAKQNVNQSSPGVSFGVWGRGIASLLALIVTEKLPFLRK